MDNDKNRDFDEKENEYPTESSTRARNRTVMLTPEITGQVRARLAQEVDPGAASDFGSSYAPGSRQEAPASGGRASSYMGMNNTGLENPGAVHSAAAGRPQAQGGGFDAPTGRFDAPRAAVPAPAPVVNNGFRSSAVWAKETPIVGFLVSYEANPNGDVYELRSGRLIVSNEPAAGGSYMVIHDESVSPMHAILRISNTGEVQVLDQLSEYGTRIKRFGIEEEEHISGEKSTIEHGDIIKFGNRTFHVCILAVGD